MKTNLKTVLIMFVFGFAIILSNAANIAAQTDTDNDGVPDVRDNCPTTYNPEKIAFVSTNHLLPEIYVMNADGTGRIRLTNNSAADFDPHFSPNGSKIAFRSDRDGNYEIYVMNADGTNPTRLTNNSANDAHPAFSPDGSKIVFTSGRDGNNEIYVMNADGTNQTRLTNNSMDDIDPEFSPDGSKIVYASGGNHEIYVMNADGTNQIQLTNNLATDGHPAFSPDGTKIVFDSFRDSDLEVYIMNADGTNQTRLTNSPLSDGDPTFSPDGTKIAFFTARDGVGNWEIYVMNTDGTNQTNVSNAPGSDFQPSWGAQADSDDDGIGDVCENTAPTITAQSVSVSRDSVSNRTVASVSDAEDEPTELTVSVDGASTVNGVTVSNLAVDSAGNVTANIAAGCSASNASFTLKVTDSGNLSATAVLNVTVTNETTPPVINPNSYSNITVTFPENYNSSSVAVNFPMPTATDNCGSVTVMTTPASGSQFAAGTTTVSIKATDSAGNMSTASFTVTVLYRFRFYDYSDLLTQPNYFVSAGAGTTIPVRFSLSGYKGANPYSQPPVSQRINCLNKSPIGSASAIQTFAGDPFYNATFDFYTTNWITPSGYAGTCRRLTLFLNDGTTQSLDFRFN